MISNAELVRGLARERNCRFRGSFRSSLVHQLYSQISRKPGGFYQSGAVVGVVSLKEPILLVPGNMHGNVAYLALLTRGLLVDVVHGCEEGRIHVAALRQGLELLLRRGLQGSDLVHMRQREDGDVEDHGFHFGGIADFVGVVEVVQELERGFDNKGVFVFKRVGAGCSLLLLSSVTARSADPARRRQKLAVTLERLPLSSDS